MMVRISFVTIKVESPPQLNVSDVSAPRKLSWPVLPSCPSLISDHRLFLSSFLDSALSCVSLFVQVFLPLFKSPDCFCFFSPVAHCSLSP
jgi:hypothetical protein